MLDGAATYDGALLVRVMNAGPEFGPVVARVVASSTPVERALERARFVRIAAALLGGDRRTLPRRLAAAARRAASVPPLVPIDVSSVSGALRAMLLVNGRVPSRQTIGRDLGREAGQSI